MALTQRVACIVGPPGTGKNKVLVALAQLFVEFEGRVAVGASSHVAVDSLCAKIIKIKQCNPTVRLGLVDMIDPVHRSLQPRQSLLDKGYGRKNKNLGELESSILDAAKVHIGTPASLSKHPCKSVLVDEAGQLTEPLTLRVLNMQVVRLILVGDHHQLPPVVHEQPGAEQGLSISALERYVRLAFPHVQLQQQYRMVSSIMQLPSRLFYRSSLICEVPDQTQPLGFE